MMNKQFPITNKKNILKKSKWLALAVYQYTIVQTFSIKLNCKTWNKAHRILAAWWHSRHWADESRSLAYQHFVKRRLEFIVVTNRESPTQTREALRFPILGCTVSLVSLVFELATDGEQRLWIPALHMRRLTHSKIACSFTPSRSIPHTVKNWYNLHEIKYLLVEISVLD